MPEYLTKDNLIDQLNGDLRLEYKSIVQYVQHIATVKGARYQKTLEEMSDHLQDELEHALALAKQIDFLGGTPVAEVPDISTETDPETALEQDLDLEETQLKRYRERVEMATALGLHDVGEALSPLLEQTQDHIRELRGALGKQ